MNANDRLTIRRSHRWAAILALLAGAAAWAGHLIETDFGKIDVDTVIIDTTEKQPMVAKVYRPATATPESPAPGLLALHGYQSDKEATSTFGALELARRGYVVVAIDQFGHGFSTRAPAANRNMSGANNGYLYLKTLPYVDKTRLGIFGHSTGALNAIRVAQQNPDHRAVNGQSSNGGEMGTINNYLLTQGLYEEIGIYREKHFPVADLVRNETRLKAFGLPTDTPLQWNHTYGNFADGSARRADLVEGTHLGVMISSDSNQSAINWFDQALDHQSTVQGFTYWYKEFSGLIALLLAIASGLCFANGLLALPWFAAARQRISLYTPTTRGTWLRFGLINIVLTMLLYPLFTQWGGAGEPLASFMSFMPLEMGNGIITWLLASGVLSLAFFLKWRNRQGPALDRLGITAHARLAQPSSPHDDSDATSMQRHAMPDAPESGHAQGNGYPQHTKTSGTAGVILRSLILALMTGAWLYAVTQIIHSLFGQELRFLWPFLKPMTRERWEIFPVYWALILLAFTAINGLLFTAQMKQQIGRHFTLTWLRWSIGTITVAVGGLVALWCIHFIPAYQGIGPGFDVLGLPQFGGRWMMMLPVIIAQFCLMIIINHWCYLKTGFIWLGAFLSSLLMAWIMVGGQVMGRFMA